MRELKELQKRVRDFVAKKEIEKDVNKLEIIRFLEQYREVSIDEQIKIINDPKYYMEVTV